MFAIISPQEVVMSEGGIDKPIVHVLGQRVAQVAKDQFPVAPPLFWMPCADDVRAETHYYDPNDQQIKPKP